MNTKTLKITLIFILIFLIIILTGFLIFALSYKGVDFMSFSWGKAELIKTENFSINNVDDIIIDAKHDVKFITSDTNEIKVNIFGKKNSDVDVSLNDNTLKINYNTSKICFGFCYSNEYIEVFIPKNYAKNVKVNTISGDIKMDSFDAYKLDIKTVSGEIELGNFNKITATSISGDIDITSGNDVEVKTTSGDIEIDNTDFLCLCL